MNSNQESDDGCFIEDNTILQQSRTGQIPSKGGNHYKKSVSRLAFHQLSHAQSFKEGRLKEDLFVKRIEETNQNNHIMDFKNQWIRSFNETKSLPPLLTMNTEKKSAQRNIPKSRRNLILPTIFSKKGETKMTKKYPRNIVRLAKKTFEKKIFQKYESLDLAKGHEHQEKLFPNPDLTLMVQQNKIDYAGRQNNGGVRLFIHRPLTVPTDPRDSIEIDNNVEAFINLEYDDFTPVSGEVKNNIRCLRNLTSRNLWYDLEVEIAQWWSYTWGSCLYEWQAKTLFKACKCLPHFYTELFDYWWNKNLRCNHHGLKCMALINGKVFDRCFLQSSSNLKLLQEHHIYTM